MKLYFLAASFLFLGIPKNPPTVASSASALVKNEFFLGSLDTAIKTKDGQTFFLDDEKAIQVELDVRYYSLKKINCTVTLSNKSPHIFYLYRPILPNDSLTENTFSILNEKNKNIKYKKRVSALQYFSDSNVMPLVLVNDIARNYTPLTPGEKISLTVNLASNYDFRSYGSKPGPVYISYVVCMPLVKQPGHGQEKRLDDVDKLEKPVYSLISSLKRYRVLIGKF